MEYGGVLSWAWNLVWLLLGLACFAMVFVAFLIPAYILFRQKPDKPKPKPVEIEPPASEVERAVDAIKRKREAAARLAAQSEADRKALKDALEDRKP